MHCGPRQTTHLGHFAGLRRPAAGWFCGPIQSPYGDTAWDWAYVAQVEIQPGHYAAAQFPGFNRVPDKAEGENAAAIEVNGEKTLMLNVPGSLHFNLTGNEKQVLMDFGFLPGAYSNGGQTPGGDYVVELRQANQPAREIFRRTLRPLTVPADPGTSVG